MAVVDGLIAIAIIVGLVYLFRSILRSRALLRRERETRDHEIRVLEASQELVKLLMLEEETAQKVFIQLEKRLKEKGKLPPTP